MAPQQLTVVIPEDVCGVRMRWVPSKAQKFASVKGEEAIETFPRGAKRATIAP